MNSKRCKFLRKQARNHAKQADTKYDKVRPHLKAYLIGPAPVLKDGESPAFDPTVVTKDGMRFKVLNVATRVVNPECFRGVYRRLKKAVNTGQLVIRRRAVPISAT